MTTRRRRGFQILALMILLLAALCWIEWAATQAQTARYQPPEHPLSVSPSPAAISEGERLAHIDGCLGCHGEHLTGRVVTTDWTGSEIVAPNLTQIAHRETDQQLAAAIRYGIKPDGTSVIGMPSSQFIRSSDSDIAALIAYLHSLSEKPDTAGKTQLHFAERARLAIGLLPLEARSVNISERGPVHPSTAPAALGWYVTQAHCAGCHGADLSGETVEGSPDLRVAIQHYSPVSFLHFFQTREGQIGHGTSTMTKMIDSRFRYLTPAEILGVYAYLKEPAHPG